MSDLVLSRRGVLRGTAVALVGVVAGYLAVRASGVAGGERGTTAANAYGPSTTGDERLLIALDEVPPGGGVILGDDGVVLTRTTDGELHAFSAVCTHQGCTVGAVNGDTIQCNCHGSQYNAADGKVKKGPAPKALAPKKITVEGDKLIVT